MATDDDGRTVAGIDLACGFPIRESFRTELLDRLKELNARLEEQKAVRLDDDDLEMLAAAEGDDFAMPRPDDPAH